MLRGRSDLSSAIEANVEDGSHSDRPDALRLRSDNSPIRRHREHFGRGLDEIADGHSPAVREQYERVARDAFAKIRELRLEVARLARFDRARELRERDHWHVQLLREGLERARDLRDLLLAALHRST